MQIALFGQALNRRTRRDIPVFVHNKFVNEFIEFDDKKFQSKGFDPRTSSVKGQFSNHYTMEPSVAGTLVYVSLLLLNLLNSLTVPVKAQKLEWTARIECLVLDSLRSCTSASRHHK